MATLTRRQLVAAVSAAFLLVCAVAWIGLAGPTGKSGSSRALMLRLAVVEQPGTPAAEIAERYARRVDELSNGSMRIAVTYWPTRFASTAPNGRLEAEAIGAVRSGEMEIGLIPASTLQDHGVTSFRPLHVPFLVTSYALAGRVTTGQIADRLQAGLGAISLTGVGLVPEGLHRAFGFLKPLLTPADFAGLRIRAPSSRPISDLLHALGARAVDLDVQGIDTAVYSGFERDAQSLPTAANEFPQNAYTTWNIALFPKIDVIAVSNAVFDRLTNAQRRTLLRAAGDARDETIRAAAGGRAGAEAFCRAGGTIVTAPESALQALRAMTAPLGAALRRDPTTSTAIASIERLEAGGTTPVRACGPTKPSIASVSDPVPNKVRDSLLPPAGSYRRFFTAAQLRAAGADSAEADRNQGLVSLTFAGPRWDLRFAVEWGRPRYRPPCRGRTTLIQRRVKLRWNPATPCTEQVAFSWKRDGRDLEIVGLDPRADAGWTRAFLGTWKLVDCTPTGPEWPVCSHHRDPRLCLDAVPRASKRPC